MRSTRLKETRLTFFFGVEKQKKKENKTGYKLGTNQFHLPLKFVQPLQLVLILRIQSIVRCSCHLLLFEHPPTPPVQHLILKLPRRRVAQNIPMRAPYVPLELGHVDHQPSSVRLVRSSFT